MKTFYWLLKREFWENRGSFLWAPVIAGGTFVLMNVMALIAGEVIGRRRGVTVNWNGMNLHSQLDPHALQMAGAGMDLSILIAAAIISVVMTFVVFFYCLGSLYDDRRDRSILFWRSLPISDRDTVLSKVASATVVAPVIASVAGVLTGLATLVLGTLAASMHGLDAWSMLWQAAHPGRVVATLIGIIPVYVVWALPSVGWLMLCSAWARSKPFLWALALPIGAGLVVGWFGLMGVFDLGTSWFWKNVVGRLLLGVLPGSWYVLDDQPWPQVNNPMDIPRVITLQGSWAEFLHAPIYIGAVAGVAMIAAAIWFRRRSDDA